MLEKGDYAVVSSSGENLGEFEITEFQELKVSNKLLDLVGNVNVDDLLRMFAHSGYYKIIKI